MHTQVSPARSGSITVNGTDIYHEIRGRGPSVAFIAGGGGDGGTYDAVAALLADEFTVLTYDRRGRSRSPRPDGWTATSIGEQADDAAALIGALGLGPAAVFASSDGGIILLDLLARRPDILRSAIVHEPSPPSDAPGYAEYMAEATVLAEAGMARGGYRGALEAILRWACGDDVWEGIDPARRDRVLGGAETYLEIEAPAFGGYELDRRRLAAAVAAVPVAVIGGAESGGVHDVAVPWVARAMGLEPMTISGAHVPYLERPDVFVAEIRPLLRRESPLASPRRG